MLGSTRWITRIGFFFTCLFLSLLGLPDSGRAQKDKIADLEERVLALGAQGKFKEAIPLAEEFVRAVTARFGPSHEFTGIANGDLGRLYQAVGRHAEAEAQLKRKIAILENTRKPLQPAYLGQAILDLGTLYTVQARFTEAEPLLRRSLALQEKIAGPNSIEVAFVVSALARFYQLQGRLNEAEPLYKRSLAMNEKLRGPEDRNTAVQMNNLGLIYADQGRFIEAEPLITRNLAISQKALGPAHPETASAAHNLGLLYNKLERSSEAETLLNKALQIREAAFGANHPDVALTLIELANLSEKQGRFVEAEAHLKRSLSINEKVWGNQHPAYALVAGNLAGLYSRRQNQFAEAEALYQQALNIQLAIFGEVHPNVAHYLRNIGVTKFKQGQIMAAYDYYRRATAIRTALAQQAAQSEQDTALADHWLAYTNLETAAWKLGVQEPAKRAAYSMEAFDAAQRLGLDAASGALAQMAARFGAGQGPLSVLVRERQDLANVRRTLDNKLTAAVSAPRERRNEAEITQLRADVAAADQSLKDATARLARDVPDYVELATPKPVSLSDAQALLRPDEVLIVYQRGIDDESFVWALTRESSRWQRIPLGWHALNTKVSALRKGLDLDDLKTAAAEPAGKLFDLGLAHELYEALVSPVADILKGKESLIIVPFGPLTSLPFHLLITDKPAVAKPDANSLVAYRQAQWLIRRHAVTVLPSVSSLRAVRVLAKAATAPKPLIGFGDPVFGQAPAKAPTATASAQRSASRTRAFSTYYRGGRADIAALRAGLAALPETAAELRAVAASVGAGETDLRLGAAASEATVKSTDMTPYRVVYFATHGLVSGELKGLAEPALALALPKEPTDLDDGLLTASEVAQLKLNADWVVLSACNTASGETPGADALSGLARAFFYAGARALLVSHWKVDSEAAVRLTTGTFAALQKDPVIGRSGALRRAMLTMIDDTKSPWNAYPDYWAPFSVVGEGGR